MYAFKLLLSRYSLFYTVGKLSFHNRNVAYSKLYSIVPLNIHVSISYALLRYQIEHLQWFIPGQKVTLYLQLIATCNRTTLGMPVTAEQKLAMLPEAWQSKQY